MNKKIILGICIPIILIVLYGVGAFYYSNHYYPKTTIDQVNIGGRSPEGGLEIMSETVSDYLLLIQGRDDTSYPLEADSYGLSFTDSDYMEEILSQQNSLLWLTQLWNSHSYTYDFSEAYDQTALETALESLDCFSGEDVAAPTDAYLEFSEDEGAFVIVPETQGSTLIMDQVLPQVEEAISGLSTSLTLTDDDYESPSVTSDDQDLNDRMNIANNYLDITITYDIYGNTEVLDASTIGTWVTVTDDCQITLDEDAIADYVQSLASKYNTYADDRQFTTSLGDTITIGGGDYGWIIDKEAEAEQIIEDLSSGQTSIEREPIYSQEAFYSSADDDIGDTYIEIDYSNQHMYYYEDGQLVLESDIVSGNLSAGNGSPDGVFKIVYKESNATLVGEDYSSAVSYFMPFAYNVGFHDASWRSEFGGDIYLTSGSHGCINMPTDKAQELFSLVATGTPVIAYYRDAVELTSEQAAYSNAYSYVDTEETTEDQ